MASHGFDFAGIFHVKVGSLRFIKLSLTYLCTVHTGRESKNDSNPIQISEYTRVSRFHSKYVLYNHLCHDVHIEHFKKLDLPNIYKDKMNILIIFGFINVWLLKFYKKVQYGYQDKNGAFSDYTKGI